MVGWLTMQNQGEELQLLGRRSKGWGYENVQEEEWQVLQYPDDPKLAIVRALQSHWASQTIDNYELLMHFLSMWLFNSAAKTTESISLVWILSMWRIKASGEGKLFFPHGQLTYLICSNTLFINPRQDRSSSGFDANLPDDLPLPCFVPPGWRTAVIYNLFISSDVNWKGKNVSLIWSQKSTELTIWLKENKNK